MRTNGWKKESSMLRRKDFSLKKEKLTSKIIIDLLVAT
jgi:hypothetical protein